VLHSKIIDGAPSDGNTMFGKTGPAGGAGAAGVCAAGSGFAAVAGAGFAGVFPPALNSGACCNNRWLAADAP